MGTHRELQETLIEQAEKAADDVFNLIQGNRQKIADNYLSLKAYAVSAADKITDYRAAGKGAGLSSNGDLLVTVGALGTVKPTAAEGPGMGGDKLQAIFSGKSFKVARPVAYMNGRSVGLSNKLSDFATLAVRMSTYESVLAKLTAKVSPPKKQNKDIVVKPPEYQGD